MERIITLDEFIIKRQKDFPYATGELTGLLRDIGVAAKIVNREVNKAGLVNILGVEGSKNESGDQVQKLDVFANDIFIDCLSNSGECCGIASEELEEMVPLPTVESKTPSTSCALILWMGHQILMSMFLWERFFPFIGARVR